MYCTRCGKEIRSDQKFCGNCGAKNVNYQEKNDLKEMIEKAAAGEENALEKIAAASSFSASLYICLPQCS